jgi:hypothetical protein
MTSKPTLAKRTTAAEQYDRLFAEVMAGLSEIPADNEELAAFARKALNEAAIIHAYLGEIDRTPWIEGRTPTLYDKAKRLAIYADDLLAVLEQRHDHQITFTDLI